MVNVKLSWYWMTCLKFVIPISLTGMLFYVVYKNDPVLYQGESYPTPALAAGWALTALACLQLPFWGLIEIFKCRGHSNALKPNAEWGPTNKRTKSEWKQMTVDKLKKKHHANLVRFGHVTSD